MEKGQQGINNLWKHSARKSEISVMFSDDSNEPHTQFKKKALYTTYFKVFFLTRSVLCFYLPLAWPLHSVSNRNKYWTMHSHYIWYSSVSFSFSCTGIGWLFAVYISHVLNLFILEPDACRYCLWVTYQFLARLEENWLQLYIINAD